MRTLYRRRASLFSGGGHGVLLVALARSLDIGFILPYDRKGRNVGGGFFEFGFILFIAFLIFGPKKLPEIARVLGKGLAELRRASYELRSSLEEEIRNLERPQDDYRPALPELRPTYGYNHSESASRESESGS